jgi:hypothetical protein
MPVAPHLNVEDAAHVTSVAPGRVPEAGNIGFSCAREFSAKSATVMYKQGDGIRIWLGISKYGPGLLPRGKTESQ